MAIRTLCIVYHSIPRDVSMYGLILAIACGVAKEGLCDEKYDMIWRELRELKHAREEENVTGL